MATTKANMAEYPFRKMHGLGNDFVVLDARDSAMTLTPEFAKAISDRKTGIGCDQILIIRPAIGDGDAFLEIRNADGGVVASCGNGSRCVARLLLDESDKEEIVIETRAGPVIASNLSGDLISVDMGPAYDNWRDIPLAENTDTLHLGITEGPLHDPVGVGIGNPHMVFFVGDIQAIDLTNLGPKLEHHTLYPERTNVEVVQVLNRKNLRMRVWERGAGITQACGTGACASMIAAVRRGLTDRKVTVSLDGGDLEIEWPTNGHVTMAGPTTEIFTGILNRRFLL